MAGYINYMDTYSKITVTITLGQNYFLGNLHGQVISVTPEKG